MVVYCIFPYGDIARWCKDQGYTELRTAMYSQNDRPLLIVDNRIKAGCHGEYMCDFYEITRYIKQSKGRNIYFGLRSNAIDCIGDVSLVVWSKK